MAVFVYWQLGLVCPSLVWALLGQDLKQGLTHSTSETCCLGCLVWSVLSSRLDCMVSPSTVPAPDARQLTALSGSLPGLVESTLHVCRLLFRDAEGCADFWASSPLCSQTSLFPPPLETPALCWRPRYLCCFGGCSGQEAGVEPSIMRTPGPAQ